MSRADRWSEADLADVLSRSQSRVLSAHRGLPRLSAAPLVTAPIVPDRYKSDTERRFATENLESWKRQGQIEEWWYEPMKGLYLAPEATYTPDFMTYRVGEGCVVYEVKGAFIREKDRQKLKLAAAVYWCFPFLLAQWKEAQWHYTRMPSA
jgi:hypothetical protein